MKKYLKLNQRQRSQGYVALVSVLVIAAVILTIGISVSLIAISEGQTSLAGKKSEEAIDFVEGCVEDVLLRLNKDGSIPTQIPFPEGICDVIINSQSGDDWTFTVSGEIDNYTKNIQVEASRGSTIAINSWLEVE